jgi:hypothetical protein
LWGIFNFNIPPRIPGRKPGERENPKIPKSGLDVESGLERIFGQAKLVLA